jgi:hydrogenase maturation protease
MTSSGGVVNVDTESGAAPLTAVVQDGKSLILGLGNDLLTDDGFGPRVARACREGLDMNPDVSVEESAVAGFRLLDLLQGYERVLILDAIQTGEHSPGTVMFWPLSQAFRGRTLGGSHQMDLDTTLRYGRLLGYILPRSITLLVAEAADLLTFGQELTPALRAALPEAIDLVHEWLDGGILNAEERRKAHEFRHLRRMSRQGMAGSALHENG